MANRYYEQFRLSLEKKVVDLYLRVSFGASGAPTIVRGKGIASITRNSAGRYTIVFGTAANSTSPLQTDQYNALLDVDIESLSSAFSAAPENRVVSESVSTGSLVIQFSAAGVATDPASGESALIHIALSNQTSP